MIHVARMAVLVWLFLVGAAASNVVQALGGGNAMGNVRVTGLHAGANTLPPPADFSIGLGFQFTNGTALDIYPGDPGTATGSLFNLQGYSGDGLQILIPDAAFDPLGIQTIGGSGIYTTDLLRLLGGASVFNGSAFSVDGSIDWAPSVQGFHRLKSHANYASSQTYFFSNAVTTTNATPTTVNLDPRTVFDQNTACSVTVEVTARQDTTNRAAYLIHASYHRTTGNVTLQGQTALSTIESNAAWTATAVAPAAAIGGVQVTGAAGVTVYWVVSGTFVCVSTST